MRHYTLCFCFLHRIATCTAHTNLASSLFPQPMRYPAVEVCKVGTIYLRNTTYIYRFGTYTVAISLLTGVQPFCVQRRTARCISPESERFPIQITAPKHGWHSRQSAQRPRCDWTIAACAHEFYIWLVFDAPSQDLRTPSYVRRICSYPSNRVAWCLRVPVVAKSNSYVSRKTPACVRNLLMCCITQGFTGITHNVSILNQQRSMRGDS